MKRLSSSLFAALAVSAITFSLAVSSQAQTVSTVASFSGSNGTNPPSTLIFDGTGHLYGTTEGGGTGTGCGTGSAGCGVVFKATRTVAGTWNVTVIHSFSGGRDGSQPRAGLVEDAAGNLYGTTYYGGVETGCGTGNGCGVVFKLSIGPSGGWKETVLHLFTGGADGSDPNGNLIVDAAGNLYGVTNTGGNLSDCGGTGCGVVFRVSPGSNGGWIETPIYTFNGTTDGSYPTGALTMDSAGNLYGCATFGGPGGYGSAFELSPSSGGTYTFNILHSFTSNPDGRSPQGSMIFDPSGNLYGMTALGGNGPGTVFELSPSSGGTWTETILYNFGQPPDAEDPMGGLVFDASGNLWGATPGGGTSGHEYGTVFEMMPQSSGTWKEKVVHAFATIPDGHYPYAGLVLDGAGNLYGTTAFGGASNDGAIYKVVP